MHSTAPTTKNSAVLNVNSADVEKPWSRHTPASGPLYLLSLPLESSSSRHLQGSFLLFIMTSLHMPLPRHHTLTLSHLCAPITSAPRKQGPCAFPSLCPQSLQQGLAHSKRLINTTRGVSGNRREYRPGYFLSLLIEFWGWLGFTATKTPPKVGLQVAMTWELTEEREKQIWLTGSWGACPLGLPWCHLGQRGERGAGRCSLPDRRG